MNIPLMISISSIFWYFFKYEHKRRIDFYSDREEEIDRQLANLKIRKNEDKI